MLSLKPTREATGGGAGGSLSTLSATKGVLLINLGTPDAPDVESVRRYLAEFLGDPEVIQLPRGLKWLNGPLGRFIARRRAPKSAKSYEQIWTERGSPLGSISAEQAASLQSAMPSDWQVFHAMRYGKPAIAETLRRVEDSGVEELVVIPMYPQFSGPTTGTALRALYGSLKRGGHRLNVATRNSWYDDGGYLHAQAKLIADYARLHGLSPENTHLVFSAHGLPVSYVERGDPYPDHVNRTVELVAQRLGWPEERRTLAFQSRVGPTAWLTPNTEDVLRELGDRGERRVLVCSVSFTTDCLETLEEIDLKYREMFERDGREMFLCPALNTSRDFIAALKNLALRGPQAVKSWGARMHPLLKPAAQPLSASEHVDSLVFVGVSMKSRVGDGSGPELIHEDERGLEKLKKPHDEIPGILQGICGRRGAREAFVWNTCYRFEFYGWESDSAAGPDDCVVARVCQQVFAGDIPEDVSVNVLRGREAWHHLVRTAAGLNSGLAGDHDVVEQLRTAHNLAQRAGTAGVLTDRLVSEVTELERRLRSETAWGRFDPGYCYAAMSRLLESDGIDLRESRILVVGGSTTSRSVLSALVDRFGVPERQLTLAYRGHGGGQIKLLRRAIRGGRRLRVQSYGEPQLVQAVAEADVVIFGIDRDEPVLDAGAIREMRDFADRPLFVVDFNTFGSTRGWEAVSGVTVVDANRLAQTVVDYTNAMWTDAEFAGALREAEDWIAEHLPPSVEVDKRPPGCPGSMEAAADSGLLGPRERWLRCVQCVGNRSVDERVSVRSGVS